MKRRKHKRPPAKPRKARHLPPRNPVGWCALHGRVLGRYWAYEVKHCHKGPCKHFHLYKKEGVPDGTVCVPGES